MPLDKYVHKTLGIVQFNAPEHLRGAVSSLTRIYTQKIMQEGPFSQIKPLAASPPSVAEALILGKTDRCDLVLMPIIESLIESSGAMPTELQVSLRLLEVDTGRVLLFVRQKASSFPGNDVDLMWNIIDGQPALRFQELGEMLAVQQVRLMASMAMPPVVPGRK